MKVKITTKENMEYYNCAKNSTIDIDIEDYVAAVVASEMESAPLQARKAQAIAARTFAIRRGVLSDKPISDSASVAQAFRATRLKSLKGQEAASQTAGLVLLYNGEPISAVYSKSNGGQTRSSQEVWGTAVPYLISQKDSWDRETKNGHGVGMSQSGAIKMAQWQKDYKEILGFYYPGAKIKYHRGLLFNRIRLLINEIKARL